MIEKIPTSCCALAQMCAGDEDSFDNLQRFVNRQREESKQDWRGYYGDKGQRALFCVTTPHELKLEKNLAKLRFKLTKTFNRRVGYTKGTLKFWWLDL